MIEFREAKEGAWEALAHAPLRRYMLGRDRCDRLVRLAIETALPGEYVAAGHDAGMRQAICERVAGRYEERCSSVFVTMILSWAISAIVQYLIRRWWNS